MLELRGEAQAAGHQVMELGTIAEESMAAGGYFLRPAPVLDPELHQRIVTEEQFGPALPILKFDDEEKVLDLVDDDIVRSKSRPTRWRASLSTAIWGSDLRLFRRAVIGCVTATCSATSR